MSALVVLGLGTMRSQEAPPCIPDGFQATYDNSICFGYAQARAFGCSNDEAAIVNATTINWNLFTRVGGIELAGIMVGDIVVWHNDGQVNIDHGHGAYVSAVTPSLPIGKFRTGSNGQVGDINPPTNWANVTLDHVPSAGVQPIQGTSFTVVHNNRMLNQKEGFYGVFRLKKPSETSTPATYRIIFKNSFGGGQINVAKHGSTYINRPSPDTGYYAYNSQIPVGAIDQPYGNYYWNFAEWQKDADPLSNDRDIIVVEERQARGYQANFWPSTLTNYVEFENRSSNTHIGGLITVAGVNRKSRTERFGMNTSATAFQSFQIDRVQYTFLRWEFNSSQYSTDLTITPTTPGLYVAVYDFNYINPPEEVNPNNNPIGQPIKITWKQHPSAFANQIQVWRKVKNVHSAMVIARLSGSATTYTDYNYVLTDGYTENLIDYDIRVRYSLTSTYSSPNWYTVFGGEGLARTIDARPKRPDKAHPASYEVLFDAFPNPFNPATTLQFSLKEDSYVEINIFNLTGSTIAVLSSEMRSAGIHSIRWDARDVSGAQLPSGTYIVRYASYPKGGSGPTALYRKLLLVR